MGRYGRFYDDFDPGFDFLCGDFGGGKRCKGLTLKGTRCKIYEDSPYPVARTIAKHGYCTKHMSQKGGDRDLCESDGSDDDDLGFMTCHGAYPRDKPHPEIVTAARAGDVGRVRALIPAGVDACRKWLEVEEKYGYDKQWEWDDDTALIAASREGHTEVVCELLCAGADPARKSCPSVDVHETAPQAAETKLAACRTALAGKPPKAAARARLEMIRRYECVINMLRKAAERWPAPKLPVAKARPAAPQQPAQMTVEQLKDVLRRHKAKVSGRKAELVQRVVDGKYLEAEQNLGENDISAREQKFEEERAAAQRKIDERSAAIRELCKLEPVTPEEVDASAGPDLPPPAPLLARPPATPMFARPPPAFQPLKRSAPAPSLLAPPPKRQRGGDPLLCDGCGRRFVHLEAITSHQRDSKRCPSSSQYRPGLY